VAWVLVDVFAWRLSGLEDKLVFCLILVIHKVGGSVQGFVDYVVGPAFQKIKLLELNTLCKWQYNDRCTFFQLIKVSMKKNMAK
jgi:hypothetical protein